MASVGNDSGGRRRILFVASDGSRKTVRLGKCDQRTAESVCRHVEALLAANVSGQPVARDTAVWLAGIGDTLHDRLARVGLVTARTTAEGTKLGPFIDAYIAGRVDAKPRTIINLKRARKALVNHFGEGKLLSAITAGDADAFRLDLLSKRLAENTVRRICGRARQFFRAAIRHEKVRRNPFEGIKCAVGANPERLYFVSRQEAEKVLAACPDAEWRLIFALSRFGGLRCPSEHLAMRWADVDWEHNRMIVRSPKTEHHEGKASRVMPIFPELRPHLLESFDNAPEGAEYVISRYRDTNANLRTQLQRIIGRAGLQAWPKLFHNLRATRETELAETFPLHVVCAWIGNSEAIAAKHYLQVTDDHFDRAIAVNAEGTQSAAQNPAQHPLAGSRKASHEPARKTRQPAVCDVLQGIAAGCEHQPQEVMPPVGAEHAGKTPAKTTISRGRGTESGTPDAGTGPNPAPEPTTQPTAMVPELARLVKVWPKLPAVIRAGILAMVDAAEAAT